MAGQSFSVINNISALNAQRDLYSTNIGLNKTLGRLSSGKRIVDASDDAAGLAIAAGLKADAFALRQAVRNANDGIAVIQIADGGLNRMTDLLMRAVTLAEQAASDTVGTEEKAILNVEYFQLLDEFDRVVSVSNFKGERLFNEEAAVTKSVYIGDTQFSSFITISIGGAIGLNSTSLLLRNFCANGKMNTTTLNVDCISDGIIGGIASREKAQFTIGTLRNAITSLSRWRGSLGAQQNRLINAVGMLQLQEVNIRAAESTITDANMAEEIMNMTASQILVQSGMASLAQANASSQMVLQLLR